MPCSSDRPPGACATDRQKSKNDLVRQRRGSRVSFSTRHPGASMLGRMQQRLLPILLTVTGAVIYQISSKSVPRAVHPLVAIIAAYFTAILLCVLATWKWPV